MSVALFVRCRANSGYDRSRASKDLPDEQKEKWQRNREQNDRLDSPDPFVHARKL
jgi:hypothetical protein